MKRLAQSPFALIGVNSDKDKEKLKVTMRNQNITWRSFWNGPQGIQGPISRAWGVRSWPTIYILDHHGIIRYKNKRGSDMDRAVDELLTKVDGSTGVAAGSNVPAPLAKIREFVDSTGQFKIRAKFVKFQGGKAFLEKEGGEVIGLSMTKLSAGDQRYIRDRLKNK